MNTGDNILRSLNGHVGTVNLGRHPYLYNQYGYTHVITVTVSETIRSSERNIPRDKSHITERSLQMMNILTVHFLETGYMPIGVFMGWSGVKSCPGTWRRIPLSVHSTFPIICKKSPNCGKFVFVNQHLMTGRKPALQLSPCEHLARRKIFIRGLCTIPLHNFFLLHSPHTLYVVVSHLLIFFRMSFVVV